MAPPPAVGIGDNAAMPTTSQDTAERLPICGVVITRNEGDRIGRCLGSMRGLCTELLVVDSGSDDDTVSVARAMGARVEHQDWLGFAAQKNHAISRAAQPWLLLLDADEWLADGTADAIRELFASGRVGDADAWVLTRRNWFLGRRLRGGEDSERLVRPGWRYLPALVHEYPDLRGKRLRRLGAEIEHDTARSYADHLRKQSSYAALWAQQRHEAGRRCGPFAGWIHAVASLAKAYVLRAAFLEGREGWLFHRAHAGYVVEKYRRLHALGRTPPARD
jgi:glycosyltransferase involved in cell wall biosynthesis